MPPGQKKHKSGTEAINSMRFSLLLLLPEFQKEVQEIRKAFDIPEFGFKSLPSSPKEENDFTDMFGLYDAFNKNSFRTPFAIRLEKLLDDYKLPYSFLMQSYYEGLPGYILFNFVSPPRHNWVIDFEQEKDQKEVRWISIKAFTALSKEEMLEAQEEFKYILSKEMSDEFVVQKRSRKNFERDLEILSQIGFGRPTIVKEYDSQYAQILFKNKNLKELKNWEKKNTESIIKKPDKKSSRQLSKKIGVSPAAVRVAKRRLNELAKHWFGRSLDPLQ